jgi:hypothetical protein
LHRWIALVEALLLSRKKLYLDFSVLEKFKKNKKLNKTHIFGSHSQKMGSMGGTFTIPEFNSSYTITENNLVRIGGKIFFGKKPCTPPFYLIFTSENHLNAHSSLVKQQYGNEFCTVGLLLSRRFF